MIVNLGRRLRLILSEREDPAPPDIEALPRTTRRIEFVAYAEDCVVTGRVRMTAGRLTDALNDHDEYELVDVFVERLADGVALEVPRFFVTRDDLLLVRANGPRGDQSRRRRTRPHPLDIETGPYKVRGYFHAPPGVDPMVAIHRREPMIPLTDAWIEYDTASGPTRQRFGTILVNREQADRIDYAVDVRVEMPEFPATGGEPGVLLKDFTGAILAGSTSRGS